MYFENAKDFILDKLERELPVYLSYHNIEHVNDVYHASGMIGKEEGVSDSDMQLLLTAACYHDSGYLFKTTGHEEESCRIATEALGSYSYNEEAISLICGMIRATRLPQSPQNHLEEIIADADLDYLGRDDYFEQSGKLFKELLYLGVLKSEDEWIRMQINFLESHHYFTRTAISLRNAKKSEHLEKIKAKLK